jgi:hypothetical protein
LQNSRQPGRYERGDYDEAGEEHHIPNQGPGAAFITDNPEVDKTRKGQITKGEKMGACTAVAKHGRISFIISKDDDGYDDFAEVLLRIEKDFPLIWYGDVTDTSRKESNGLVLTHTTREGWEK